MSELSKKVIGPSVYLKHWVRVGILMLAVLVSILAGFSTDYAQAAGIKIKYDGKKRTYTGAQTTVTYDGEKVSLGGVSGIIIDNTCMVPFKEVFVKGLGAEFAYDSASGSIVLEQHGMIINMTIGSKTAYVNGQKMKLDVAPKKIKFYSPSKTKVFVPARFVAENLGYGYEWNNSARTSEIISPIKLRFEAIEDWEFYTGVKGSVTYNSNAIDVSDLPGIMRNDTLLIQAEKVFSETLKVEYTYNEIEQSITLRRNDVTIVMYIDSNMAFVNGLAVEMGTSARMVTVEETGQEYVMIPAEFTAEKLGYGYSWNANTDTAVITRVSSDYTSLKWDEILMMNSYYNNLVKDITISHNNNLDIVSIISTYPVTPIIAEEGTGSELHIEIPNVYNQIQTIEKHFTDGVFVNGVTVSASATGISVNLSKNMNGSYYVSQSGDTVQIVFCENITTDVANSLYQMKFVLPSGMSMNAITDEDRYHENTFILTIPGDCISHFAANPILYNPSVISQVMLSLNDEGNTEIKVITHELQGYRLNDCGDYIGINVANPSKIYKNIVVLDAGHGGKDPGALNSSTNEKSLTLKIIYDYAKKYFNDEDSTIKAYWTRQDDTYVTLADRAAFAEEVEADLFISLHMNSASSKSAKGLEVLYGSNNTYTMSDLDSKKMASIFKEQLIYDLNMTDRGIKDRPNLVVLKTNTVPAVLIELGFISNSSDFKKLKNADFQERVAASIYEAAVHCFEEYPTGR